MKSTRYVHTVPFSSRMTSALSRYAPCLKPPAMVSASMMVKRSLLMVRIVSVFAAPITTTWKLNSSTLTTASLIYPSLRRDWIRSATSRRERPSTRIFPKIGKSMFPSLSTWKPVRLDMPFEPPCPPIPDMPLPLDPMSCLLLKTSTSSLNSEATEMAS